MNWYKGIAKVNYVEFASYDKKIQHYLIKIPFI